MRITPNIQLKFSDCAILENDDDNDDGGIENQNLPPVLLIHPDTTDAVMMMR